jgi:GTP cyclohydrolase I
MTDNLKTLFSFINDETVRNKLLQSEKRIRRSFDELFSGYKLKAEDVLNDVVRVDNYSGIVRVDEINFYSFCEHHFAPFFGTAAVLYEPQSIITGLGKIVRLVREVHSRRLQIQEIMTRDIAEDIKRVLAAKGALVITKAKHLCICSRGPRDDSSVTTVTYGCGTLATQPVLAINDLVQSPGKLP